VLFVKNFSFYYLDQTSKKPNQTRQTTVIIKPTFQLRKATSTVCLPQTSTMSSQTTNTSISPVLIPKPSSSTLAEETDTPVEDKFGFQPSPQSPPNNFVIFNEKDPFQCFIPTRGENWSDTTYCSQSTNDYIPVGSDPQQLFMPNLASEIDLPLFPEPNETETIIGNSPHLDTSSSFSELNFGNLNLSSNESNNNSVYSNPYPSPPSLPHDSDSFSKDVGSNSQSATNSNFSTKISHQNVQFGIQSIFSL
jgi:hypothetical protein